MRLEPGQVVSLFTDAGAVGPSAMLVEVTWLVRDAGPSHDLDVDACVLVCAVSGQVVSDAHFVFFNNLVTPDRSVECLPTGGVNATATRPAAATAPDREYRRQLLRVSFDRLPRRAARLLFVLSIHDADRRRQDLSCLAGAGIRLLSVGTEREIVRYELTDFERHTTAMILGECQRNTPDWVFRALDKAYASGLGGIVRHHGVRVRGS